MIITKEQLIEKIQHHGFKNATFYDRVVSPEQLKDVHIPYFERYDEKTPLDLVNRIENFASNYPGQFTISLRTSNGGYNGCLVTVRFNQAIQQGHSLNGTTNGVPYETPEQMEARIMKKIQDQMKVQLLEQQVKTLQGELLTRDSLEGKLVRMGEMWLRAKMGQKVPELQNNGLNGATDTGSTEITAENINEALRKLLDLLGAETIINLSKKMNPGDPMIAMVQNFANS